MFNIFRRKDQTILMPVDVATEDARCRVMG